MSNTRAALRYAKATLAYATEQKVADKVLEDMRAIAGTIKENSDLAQLLNSPIIKIGVKQSTLNALFKKSETITKGLLETLTQNKRIELLLEVAYQYIIQYDKAKGEDTAIVTTAVPLTATLEKKFLAKIKSLSGKEVTLDNQVDENVLGGFVLRMGDVQYDASLANKLNTLKQEFTNSL
ncbi:MAG: ATP synthase F1 subunit delta [Bacteroidota bacterium]